MQAKKCDRCLKYFEPRDFIILKTKSVISGTYSILEHEYDLCEDCQKEFYDFLDGYKEEVENNEKE